MGTMVFCQSCRTVIWAYDSVSYDLRGIANFLRLPCPKCGDKASFDGWVGGVDFPFGWTEMRELADKNKLAWEISPNCDWFKRPEEKSKEILLEI